MSGVTFSPDGRQIAAAGWDGGVKLWDSATGHEIFTLRGHTREVHGVAFSPSGRQLASASRDGTVKLWDARSGNEILTLKGHSGAIWGVAFSPDGRRIGTSRRRPYAQAVGCRHRARAALSARTRLRCLEPGVFTRWAAARLIER